MFEPSFRRLFSAALALLVSFCSAIAAAFREAMRAVPDYALGAELTRRELQVQPVQFSRVRAFLRRCLDHELFGGGQFHQAPAG